MGMIEAIMSDEKLPPLQLPEGCVLDFGECGVVAGKLVNGP